MESLARFSLLAMLIFSAGSKAEEAALEFEVEEVAPHFVAARAGIQENDRIVGWTHANDEATEPQLNYFHSPFDLRELEREQHLVDPITLHGTRAGEAIVFSPRDGRWRLSAQPIWPTPVATSINAMRHDIEEGNFDSGVGVATSMAEQFAGENQKLDGAWVLYQAAILLGRKAEWNASVDLYQLAIDLLSMDNSADLQIRQARALLLYYQGGALLQRDRFDEAEASYGAALALEKTISADRYGIAANLTGLSDIPKLRGDLAAASNLLDESLEQLHRIAPDSMIVAATLNKLGIVAARSGDLDGGEQHFQRAFEIYSKKDPNGVAAAGNTNSLAVISYMRGDLAEATSMFERARQAKLRLEPNSKNLATLTHNVGLINAERGNFRAAESYYLEALALLEKLVPGSLETTMTLNNLGTVALDQGDLAKAEYYHGRAYELRRKLVPNSPDLVASLVNLGSVARYRRELEESEKHLLEALAIQERIAVGSREHARILQGLGAVADLRDDSEVSTNYFRKALGMYREIAAHGPGVAESYSRLGFNALKTQDFDSASDLLKQAATILSRIAPDTYREARALHGLALASQHQGESESAREYFEKALLALESQHSRLGGTQESKAESRAKHRSIYQDYIDLLLELGDEERAFEILERSRAKVLSDLLVERDLVFNNDIPKDLERERRMLASAYEKTQADLFSAKDAERIAVLRVELEAGRRKQDDVRRRVREHSASFASLQENRSLSLQEIRAALAPGTAVLSYSVGEERTHVFSLSPRGELHVETIALGRTQIGNSVQRFRYLIDAGRWDESPATPLLELAAVLYEQLVAPSDKHVSAAKQILIVPDAALNLLPFAALRRQSESDRPQYLIEWKSLLLTNSLSVQAQLREDRSGPDAKTLVAFGNADYSNARTRPTASGTTRGVDETTAPLPSLPWSATEVSNIADTTRRRSIIYLGQDATEEKAKQLQRNTDYLHFAAHTLVDERSPLDTAIVLTVPGTDADGAENGYLQAWEIYESVRIDAELVTLSGCETALGSEYPGEGLMGLTRAFQYAGASSVVASLWNVDDRSTSRLMTEFYQHLDDGETKESALRQAQLAMIKSAEADSNSWWRTVRGWFSNIGSEAANQHPYHWAGFVLNGRGG